MGAIHEEGGQQQNRLDYEEREANVRILLKERREREGVHTGD